MQHVAQGSESEIKLEDEITTIDERVGSSSTPSSPRSPQCSPPGTPPDTPPERLAESFHFLSDSSGSGEEDISEGEESNSGGVDPETQARLQSLLKAAGINKLTSGDGKQLADPEVLRRLTSSVSCALDEAAAALTRMRSDNRQASKRALIKACMQGNVSAVRKLLKQGVSVNEKSEEGESLLSLACSAGYYELAQVLLAMKAKVDDRGSKADCTPLMETASSGFSDLARLLLAHGAEVNAQSATGNTPLMYACAGGHVGTVQVLLDTGANVEDHNENGHTPLMEAASAGHVEVAKLLLKYGAGINTHSNEFKESALTLACYKGHLEMVNFLLQAGADQEHKTDEMHTALMEASMDGHVEVAKLLLDSGAQVNMPTDSFESPLTLAACGGHVELAILLIERGANIEEVNDEGYTPLMEAAREGHEEMVAVLLQRGARINAQTEETQETALTLACCGGFMEVADYLIKNGADLELGASTPVMEAAQEGHLELVRFLLDKGANVQAQTQTGDTALTYACENGHTDVADLLLEYGANLEHESEGGRTPLMKACRAGHLCTVQFLVSKDADINRQTTNNDHTPLSLACAGGHLAIVQFLLDKGANMFHKLKDNSTMLIEAAKGGHTTVVQLLLDYPERRNANVVKKSKGNATTAAAPPQGIAATTAANASTNIANATAVGPTSTALPAAPIQAAASATSVAATQTCPLVPSNEALGGGESSVAACVTAAASTKNNLTAASRNNVPLSSLSCPVNGERSTSSSASGVRNTNALLKAAAANVKLKRQSTPLQSQPHSQQSQSDQIQLTKTKPQASAVTKNVQSQQLPVSYTQSSISRSLMKKALQDEKVSAEIQKIEQFVKEFGADVLNENIERLEGCTGACSVDLYSPSSTIPAGSCTTDANLPLPPPLIPISEVLQSTAISDRPKAKPTKKEGKLLRKQLLQAQQTEQSLLSSMQQVQQNQIMQQQSGTLPLRSTSAEEAAIQASMYQAALQQQAQASQLKQLALINAQLQQQVIKNQQQIELQQQQQQQLLQQQTSSQRGGQQSPQLVGSGTITVTSNFTDMFNHQELLAQIQQIDSNFIQNFPDFAEKTLDLKAMQQMMACEIPETLQESLQRCHFLTSLSEDEVSIEDIANSALTIEEKRLCDGHQNAIPLIPSLLDATLKGADKNTISILSSTTDLTTGDENMSLPNLSLVQQNCMQMFSSIPMCSTVQESPTSPDLLSDDQSSKVTASVQTPPKLQHQAQQQLLQLAAATCESSSCPSTPTPKPKGQARQVISTSQPKTTKDLSQHGKQKVSLSQVQQQHLQKQQLLEQKQQLQQQLLFQQKLHSQKQNTATTSSESITLNSQARQELHRHLSEMKAIAQNAAAHQNQIKCSADTTGNHTASTAQSSVSSVKAKIPFDDANNTLSKLGGFGKRMRSNTRVPSNAASHGKDEGGNVARVPSTNVAYNQSYSMDVDSETESNHDTALTLACAGGHEELVELLLSRGADIEHRDKKGFTPMILAATAGHEKVVELLLNHNADIEAQSERTKDTPLSLACSGGRYEVVDLLLARGANKEHRNVSDYTPLSLAASGGYVNIIRLLLSHGAEINSRTGSKLGISPLMLAAMNGHTVAVKLLLDMGSDINAQIETNRNTALTLACFQGRHEVVSLLLERKANVEHRAKTGLTPLMEAASGGYVDVGRVLLEKYADVNAPPVPSSRDTALTIASDKGHVRFVELLITKGAQVEVKNKKGNSPMWLAANGGHLQVVELLHSVGADIDSQDNRKVSCLMAAFRKGHVKTVTWMVDRVNQFPSDQEMTRYISTINDKDLLDKCHASMKIIRISKDEQAEKANEFATILLEELDMEKTREEFKKMAAARRKERKREKKIQKMFEKRKQMGTGDFSDDKKDDDEDMEDEYASSSPKDKKDLKTNVSKRNVSESTNRRNNLDVEEGDSGIDANSLGSCSSNEVKGSSTERLKDKKSKKVPVINGEIARSLTTMTVTKRESRSAEKVSSEKDNKKKKKTEKDLSKEDKQLSSSKESKAASTKLPPKNKISNEPVKLAKETKSKASEDKTGSQIDKKKKEVMSSMFENKNLIVDDDFEPVTSEHKRKKQTTITNSEEISANLKNIPSTGKSKITVSTKKNGEEEWKEVQSRKNPSNSPTPRIKKVSVSINAISRVIGRGGCNINAIRSATGAQIDIEKQAKGQGERIITIKGSIETTKQAQTLIEALVDDPELDITQILPKSLKPTTSVSSLISKAKSVAPPISPLMAKTLTNTGLLSSVVNASNSFSKVSSALPVSAGTLISSANYAPAIRTGNMIRPGIPKAATASLDKKPNVIIITTTVSANAAAVPASATKTTMSYTSAIMMSSGKQGPIKSAPVISTTTVVSQTFASKVCSEIAGSASVAKDKESSSQPAIKVPIAPPPPTSTSIFIRPPPTASAPPILPTTASKPPFSVQTSSPSMSAIASHPLPSSPAQLSQQMSHPPPPLPNAIMSNGHQQQHQSAKSEVQITNSMPPSEHASPVNAASEYSLFNDTFTKVTQQSMWGRDNSDDSSCQKSMNFASVVTASGPPAVSATNVQHHPTFIDAEPQLQVDASKAPGYRGNALCSPNIQKPTSGSIRSSSAHSPSSSSSLSFSSSTSSSVSEQMSVMATAAAVAAANSPIGRPTSVPCSLDGSSGVGGASCISTSTHSFTARALFSDKPGVATAGSGLYPCNDQLSTAPVSVAGSVTASAAAVTDDLSRSLMRLNVVSRLNPRAPDFRVPVKQQSAGQLPPTHQPPPTLYNQQQQQGPQQPCTAAAAAAPNYMSSVQLPPTIMAAAAAANSNMMSYPISSSKFAGAGAAASVQTGGTDSQTQWSLMNATAAAAVAAAQHNCVGGGGGSGGYSQNDLINFVAGPTTLNSLIHAQAADMMAGLENGCANAAAGLIVGMRSASASGEERKMPPKPIGTERAWRSERERTLPMDQDAAAWMLEQKQAWSQQQIFRGANPPTKPPPPPTGPYSCMAQVPDDVRASMIDGSSLYQNDHFSSIVQNSVLQNTLAPLLPGINMGQVSSGPILQSFNPDLAAAYADSFKVEPGSWDPNRVCMTDVNLLPSEKSHHQQNQPQNWTLSWNH